MPAFCSLNGLSAMEATVTLPRIGVWHADLSMDAYAPQSGKATITLGTQTLIGSFARNGVDTARRLRARVVGGAGGLATVLQPRSYGAVPLKIPLSDALRDAGETLSPSADTSLLTTQLSAWSRMQASASAVIASLLQVIPNAVWRVLLDGTVWFGFESWPTTTLSDVFPMQSEPEKGRVTIASVVPALLPGTAFQFSVPGQGVQSVRASMVHHLVRATGLRTVIYAD
jgi:hypothetical protein